MSKVQLRKRIAEILQTISADEISAQSKRVTEKILAHSKYKSSNRVSIYISMPKEIDTTSLIEDLFTNGKQVFVPRFDSKHSTMDMVRLQSMNDFNSLPKAKWDIKQPRTDEIRENALESGGVDLVITPGVAFTTDGKRLGHGKGYYDQFFAEHVRVCGKKPYSIALALRQQILDDVVVTERDHVLDEVIFDE